MSEVALFVLLTFAVARLTRLLTMDELVAGLRDRVTSRLLYPEQTPNVRAYEIRQKLVYLLTCAWCASIWVAGVAVLVHHFAAGLSYPVYWWLALSASSVLVIDFVDGTRKVRIDDRSDHSKGA